MTMLLNNDTDEATTGGTLLAPKAPKTPQELDIPVQLVSELALKQGSRAPQFTTEAIAEQLCLPRSLIVEVLEQLRLDRWIEILGESGSFNYRFAVTGRGRERAARLFDVSGYVGPAPVAFETYASSLASQFAQWPKASAEDVADALKGLVLPPSAVEVAGLAISSGRSLLIYGPTGNGKTAIAQAIHHALSGQLWLPYCVEVDGNIVRMFDPHCHRPIAASPESAPGVDRRWIRIHRPFVMVGGELTLDSLELAFHPVLRYYEAPLHWKANGGTFLVDDLGCQRISPQQLLNRWIVPLEHQVDYLTLQTGQQIRVPFQQTLMFSTNLDPDTTMEAALLRRMGYRLHVDNPAPQHYAEILNRYAARCGLSLPAGLIERLLQRYHAEQRPLRSCEPRDLLERVRDICRYRGQPFVLTDALLDSAWTGYFGNSRSV